MSCRGHKIRIMCQLKKVFVALLTIFGLNVQKDNSDLVLDGQTLVQQDGHYVAHVVTDFLTLCVLAHSQVLLNFAQFVHVALEKPFRLKNCF